MYSSPSAWFPMPSVECISPSYQRTASGLPGISSIIYWATGCPVQIPYFIVNSCLIVAAWIILGKKFCMKTIYAVIVVTLPPPIFLIIQKIWSAPEPTALGSILRSGILRLWYRTRFFCGRFYGRNRYVAAIVNKYRDISLAESSWYVIFSSFPPATW